MMIAMTSLGSNVQSAVPIIYHHVCHMVAPCWEQQGVLAGSLFIHPDRSFPVDKPTVLPNKPTAVIQPKSTHHKPSLFLTEYIELKLQNTAFHESKILHLGCRLFSDNRRYLKTTRWKTRTGDEVCCLVSAPVMTVVVQSACALCPLQTLPRPLASNTLQAASSFKQNPHDTFIIASFLIRGPFQRWLNNTPG